MENKLAEAINTVRGALQEIERRESAAEQYIKERQVVADDLNKVIAVLEAEKAELEKTVADARAATQKKLLALQAATSAALKGI